MFTDNPTVWLKPFRPVTTPPILTCDPKARARDEVFSPMVKSGEFEESGTAEKFSC